MPQMFISIRISSKMCFQMSYLSVHILCDQGVLLSLYLLAMIFLEFSVSWFVLPCLSHFSDSNLECLRHLVLLMRRILLVRYSIYIEVSR